MRQLILLGIVVAALVAILWARPAGTPSADMPALNYVTTAHQLGVVGYRDPPGAISPDGKRFAYAEGRFIRVIPIGGGAPVTLPAGEGQIRYLTWSATDTIVAEDPTATARWWKYPMSGADRQPLWSGNDKIPVSDLRQLTWRSGGQSAAAISVGKDGAQLWTIRADGGLDATTAIKGRVSSPAWTDDGVVACVVDSRLSMPCGDVALRLEPDVDVHGPIAFRGSQVYFASPDGSGMVALWTADVESKKARRISSFSRDAYGPSAGGDTVVFKTQTYRTFLADAPAAGGATRQLATFQSGTPSYHPARNLIAFTYGTWRRQLDDAKYPDIAQEIGVIDVGGQVPLDAPSEVIAKSDSEDQAMAWSPNGQWIAFHTHREMSDDVWLRPADGSQPDKRITFLGRGAEVGWPRWSPDGRTVLLNGARKRDGASVLYIIGVDQDSGELTSDLKEVEVTGIDGEMGHSEWLPDSRTIVAMAKEGPGRHVIFMVPASGGSATIVHRYATEHDFSGLGASTNGKWVAFAAPAADGFYQIFKKEIAGNAPPIQLTTDPSNKTQPTFSPDASRVAFTVWSYDATFYSFRPR